MKRMLFNATQPEELRVAIVDGQRLIDLDIESTRKEQRKSNIYKGVVTRVEPSLEAAFVDYGVDRHGFLPLKEVSRDNLRSESGETPRGRMTEILREGTELMVQVDKDERGNKGAALTTYISLAGRYLVLMPNNPRGGGVSRRVEGEDRTELREIMNQLDVPEGMSTIARTAGIGRSSEELQWDLNYLMRLWEAIESASNALKAPQLLYRESNLVIRAIRDLYHPEIGEILIDSPAIYKDAMDFVRLVIPGSAPKVKLYQDEVPLFSRFQIEHQIETAYRREVALPSGGAIVIDKTEALGAIDVNSARATKGADIEQTALNTNLEAADEIARQLRLRDLGGLIVVDFIDMENPRNQREVENRFREALKYDRARVQTGKISRFGLMELSRQRLQGSIAEASHSTCPRCSGTGQIRDVPSSSLRILRLIGEEAMKENTGMVRAYVPVAVATYLLNEKRSEIAALEARLKVNIILIPSTAFETPNFQVERLRPEELNREDVALPSYEMAQAAPTEEEPQALPISEPKAPREQPAVRGITPDQPAPLVVAAPTPTPVEPNKGSLLQRLFGWFKSSSPAPARPAAAEEAASPRAAQRGDDNHQRRDRNDRNRGAQRNENRENRGGRGERGDRWQERDRNEARRDDRGDRKGGGRDSAARGERQERGNNNPRQERSAQPGGERVQQEVRQERDRGDQQRRDQRPRSERPAPEERETRQQQEQRPQSPPRERVVETPDEPSIANEAIAGDEQREPRRGRNRRGGRRERQRERNHRPERGDDQGGERNEDTQRQIETMPVASAETVAATFVPHEDRIVSDAVSLPRMLADEGSFDKPAVQPKPPATPMPPVRAEPVAPAAANLNGLELVTTRASALDTNIEANADRSESNARRRPRRRPASRSAEQTELVLVETQSAVTTPMVESTVQTQPHPHTRRNHRASPSTSPSDPLEQVETRNT